MNNIEPHHNDEAELFLCDCSDSSHQMIFQLFDFGRDGREWPRPPWLWRPADTNCELSISVFLNSYLPFWKRVWLAVRYIFGYRSKYGEFDVVSLRYEDVPRMKAILDKFTGRVDEYIKQLEAINNQETESQKITREIAEILEKLEKKLDDELDDEDKECK